MAEEPLPEAPPSGPTTRPATIQATFAGPLPPPIALQGYEMIVPGAAERILRMAETDQQQALSLQAKVVEQEIFEGRMARWSALILPIFGLSAATVLILSGHDVAGGAIGVAALGAPLVAAVLRRRD